MRLQTLSIRNFRCFDEVEVDLSSDIIAIYGRNGVGKTALFDALEFGLLGSIERFAYEKNPPDYIPNVHTHGNVEIGIEFSDKSWIRIERSREAHSTPQVTTSLGTKNRRTFLYKTLVTRDYSPARQEISAVADLFRSTVLLSQHSIRRFIEGEPDERARVISHLAGSAYFQRCLDKSIAVRKEAEKKESKENSLIEGLEERVSETRKRITECESRLVAIPTRIDSQVVPFSSVVEALHRAAFPLEITQPQNSDEGDAFLIAVSSAQDELSFDLRRRSSLLSELFALALSQPERLRRQGDLQRSIAESNHKLISGRSKERELETAEANHDKNLGIIDSDINKLQKLLKSISNLVEAERKRDQFRATVESVRERVASLNKDHDDLTLSVRQFEVELAATRNELTTSDEHLAETISECTTLRYLYASLGQYTYSRDRIRDSNLLLKELQSKRILLDSNRSELIGILSTTEAQLADVLRRKSLTQNKAQEASHLVSQLKSYVEDGDCPLCGHTHSSREALLRSIEERLRYVPPEIQEIARREQDVAIALESAKHNLAFTNQEIEKIDNEMKRASSEVQEAAMFVQSLEVTATRIGIILDSNILQVSVAKCEEGINTVRELLEATAKQIAGIQGKLDTSVRNLQVVTTQLGREQVVQEEIGARLETVEALISTLRAEERFELDPAALTESQIKSQLGAQQEARSGELIRKVEIQKQTESLRTELRKQEENIKRWEQELANIAGEINSYQTKCRALNLDPGTSSEGIEKERLALTEREVALEATKTLSEQYALSLRVAALEETRDALNSELKALETQVTQHKLAATRCLEAAERSSVWAEELSQSINEVVERRIDSHNPEINRLFRSMVPTPYLYDGVVMSRRNGGLKLGIQYAGLKADSGEPKFFLSNAQANVLALALFLSFALRNRWTSLQCVLLDDPIQHLDDLDAVAFLDNVRSFALGDFPERKQIVLSTCDRDLYLLMIRKFRLLKPNGIRFTALSLAEKSTGAPQITYDIGGPQDRRLLTG
jgi:exonuclease SbcC